MTERTGRPSIFRPKDDTQRMQVVGMTERGRALFEQAREQLKKVAKWPGRVSDADVIEALVRGKDETAKYLKEKQ